MAPVDKHTGNILDQKEQHKLFHVKPALSDHFAAGRGHEHVDILALFHE